MRRRSLLNIEDVSPVSGDYVDLGLPSGLMWAKGNLIKNGTTGEYSVGEETDQGTYTSWGNIIGRNEGDGYDFSNGTYYRTPGNSVRTNISPTDTQHDICAATLGTPWHLPTNENFQELYDNTDNEWTTINGVNGYKFMKKTDHSVYVFFPASGLGYRQRIQNRGSNGNYWSSSWYSDDHAYRLTFNDSSAPSWGYGNRDVGLTIRPVTLPFAQLSIHFQDDNNNALANTEVSITDSTSTRTLTTDSNGNISTIVINGTVTLSIDGYILSTSSFNISSDWEASVTAYSAYVDLGLPSGTLWARGNIVKDANGNYTIGNETDWGTYISWGNIIGHNEGEGYNFDQTIYNSTPGASISADIPNNDAAHDIALAKLGNPLHLPTKEDFQELYDNTDTEWVANYNNTGVAGRKFMKKSDHSVYVFFPASGYYNGTTLNGRGTYGNYWSASFYSATSAYSLYFSSSGVDPQFNSYRRIGRSVRPVQTPITLTLDPSSKSVTAASGSYTFTVYANSSILKDSNVTVSSDSSWATPSYSSSTGKVTVSYSANTDTTSRRTAVITVAYNSSTGNHTVTQSYDYAVSSDYTYDYSTSVFDINSANIYASFWQLTELSTSGDLDCHFIVNGTVPVTLSKRSKTDNYVSGNRVTSDQYGQFNGTVSIQNESVTISHLVRNYKSSSGGSGSSSDLTIGILYPSDLGGAYVYDSSLLHRMMNATISQLQFSGYDYTAHIAYTTKVRNESDSSWTTVNTTEEDISGNISSEEL